MNSCLICHNPTDKSSICQGCINLVKSPEHTCLNCALELKQQQQTCGECQKHPPYFSKVHSGCDYSFPADDWVKGLKFANQLSLSKVMADLIAIKLQNQDLSDTLLVPVPLHKNRLRKRGYNQAYEVARELKKLTGQTLLPALKRIKNTEMQAQLKFKQRANNVRNAFQLRKEIKGQKVMLIDDVMTSGYTLNECARVLNRGKAKTIEVAVFARRS